jgi:hypothetical protein
MHLTKTEYRLFIVYHVPEFIPEMKLAISRLSKTKITIQIPDEFVPQY